MKESYTSNLKCGRLCALGAAFCFAALVAGCGTVRPEPDFQRVGGLIEARTGIAEVYNPVVEAAAQEKVAELLADGVTLDEAVRVAFLNNRAFQAQFHEIGASRADVVQSGLLSNPSLFLSARLPEGGGRSNLSISLAQNLVELWRIPVRKKIAKKQLEKVVLSVVQSAMDLRARVKTTGCELLALRQAEAITKENIALAERSLNLARGRFQAGESGILDVNLARASVLDMKMRLVAIRRDETTAEVMLEHSLGLSAAAQDWVLTGALPHAPAEIGDDASLLLRAVDERIDVQIAASELAAAQQELRRQYRAVFPNISLGVDLERSDQRAPVSLPYNPLGNLDQARPGREFVRGYVVDKINAKRDRGLEKRQNIELLLGPSLQVTLPVLDQNRAQIAKARYRALQREKACGELLESIFENVQRATAAVRGAGELTRYFAEESLPLARENVEIARRTYEAGEASILLLIEAQKSLIQQREAYAGVLRDQAVALVELERALGGRLLPRPMDEAPRETLSEDGNSPRDSDGASRSVAKPLPAPLFAAAREGVPSAHENGRAADAMPRGTHDG